MASASLPTRADSIVYLSEACGREDLQVVLRVQVSSLMDRDVIYITGRDKSQKSKNGKSANLNNTLQLIYPEIRDPYNNDEFMKIPIHELMCLFDADQTCSKVPPSPVLCAVLRVYVH
jgi:hypothetical protein